MNILPSIYRESVHFLEQRFLPQLIAQQKLISALALIAFSCLAACYAVYYYCFKDRKKDSIKAEVIKEQPGNIPGRGKGQIDDKKGLVDDQKGKDFSIEGPKDIPQIKEEAKVAYKKGIETFSFEVLQKVLSQSPEGNQLISPLGISFLLSMIKHGMRLNEQLEIDRIIHLPRNEYELKVSAFELIKSLQKTGFDLAGLIYLNPHYRLNPDYQKLVSPYYQSKVQEGESADDINQWVKNITNGQIPEILTQEDLEDFFVVLANAIHFKAKWAEPFKEDDTYLADFITPTQKVKVKMMHKTDKVDYFEDDKCQAIKLNYSHSKDVSLMLILPKKDNDFSSIDQAAFDAIAKGMENTMVKIALPKFKLEQEVDVKEMLQEMGMKDLFGKPDFSKLIDYQHLAPDRPEISKMKQKAALVCDEEGTEASVVTVAVCKAECAYLPPEPKKVINFDRPFLAALVTKDAPVLFGVVRDPQLNGVQRYSMTCE